MNRDLQLWNAARAGKKLVFELEHAVAALMFALGKGRNALLDTLDPDAIKRQAQPPIPIARRCRDLMFLVLRIVELTVGWKVVWFEVYREGNRRQQSAAACAQGVSRGVHSPAELALTIDGVDVLEYALGSMDGLSGSDAVPPGITPVSNPFLAATPPSRRLQTAPPAKKPEEEDSTAGTAMLLHAQEPLAHASEPRLEERPLGLHIDAAVPRGKVAAAAAAAAGSQTRWMSAALALLAGCAEDLAPHGEGAEATLALVLTALAHRMSPSATTSNAAAAPASYPPTLQGRVRAAEIVLATHIALVANDRVALEAALGRGCGSVRLVRIDAPAAGGRIAADIQLRGSVSATESRAHEHAAGHSTGVKKSPYHLDQVAEAEKAGAIAVAVAAARSSSKPTFAMTKSTLAAAARAAARVASLAAGRVARTSFGLAVDVYGHGIVPELQRRRPGAPHLFSALELLQVAHLPASRHTALQLDDAGVSEGWEEAGSSRDARSSTTETSLAMQKHHWDSPKARSGQQQQQQQQQVPLPRASLALAASPSALAEVLARYAACDTASLPESPEDDDAGGAYGFEAFDADDDGRNGTSDGGASSSRQAPESVPALAPTGSPDADYDDAFDMEADGKPSAAALEVQQGTATPVVDGGGYGEDFVEEDAA